MVLCIYLGGLKWGMYRIGDIVKDDNEDVGIVCIKWANDDLCHVESNDIHENVKKYGNYKSDIGIRWD